ncbi:Uncharacterized protein T06_2927 [Trichinella sp. T6]|nr:Uncharacterized protein T06_2927 [Trichinella sp. T6]
MWASFSFSFHLMQSDASTNNNHKQSFVPMIMLLFCFLIAAFSFLQPTCGELFWNVRDPFKADLFTIESRSNTTNSQLHDNSLNFYLSNNSMNVLANLNAVQAGKIDRRAEESWFKHYWWNLYPFGEKFHDVDMTDQPWKDLQIDLDFYFPFYGFRFNYSFIYPEGFVAFSYPEYVQPPYSFPNPLWPLQHDPSFIAAFLSDQSFVHVGETQISHVWYRIVTRPQYRWKLATLDAQEHTGLLSQPARVEDPALLDAITRDIRENMVGTIGYTADYALIVTWERMGYGGQPNWAGHCEFYYWRRATSGCQNYEPAVIGTAYGHGHFITFDKMKYSFSGRGYFVLTQLKTADRNLMIQIRMEQPPETMCMFSLLIYSCFVWHGTHVAATVITGVAVKEDDSSVVQVFSRKQFRRWRYRTDVFVDGQRHFFDLDRRRFFGRVLVYVPHLVMNQSEVYIQLTSGVGVKVIESRGILQVIVALPPNYKQRKMNSESAACTKRYVTMGLLGTYNGDVKDEFIASDCSKIHITQSRSEENSRTIHHQFGMKWDVNKAHISNLFGSKPEPLYYPNLFYQQNFSPVFDPWAFTNFTPLEVLIFSREQEVQVTCQGVYSCMYDYLVSGRRDFALDTLSSEKKFEYDKLKGEQKRVDKGLGVERGLMNSGIEYEL